MSKRGYSIIIFFLLCATLKAQLSLTLTKQANHFCNGCNYSGGSILINEVMISPAGGDGSIFGNNDTMRGEWIELYNPDSCCPKDISCYYLGNNTTDAFEGNPPGDYPGGFEIPQGTVVPPAGFVIVRGLNAPSVPGELLVQNGGKTIEYVVGVNQQYCLGGGVRLWFPNAGGWFAFYDETGVPQDAIYWNDSLNFEHFTNPCNPQGGCELSSPLPSFAQIPQQMKSYISSGGPINGYSFKRVPDGGPWAVDVAYSPTYGDCNIQPCPLVNPCNGSITASVTGGLPPYTYIWNDCRKQTTPTITGVCEGYYCVTVTDASGVQVIGCDSVINHAPVVDINPVEPLCQYADSLKLTQGTPAGGYYVGDGIDSGYLNPMVAGPGNHMIFYVVDNGVGCYAKDSVIITIWPAPIPAIDALQDSVCQGGDIRLMGSASSGSGSGYEYLWSGPAEFTASGRDVIIKEISIEQGEYYYLMVIDSRDCSSGVHDSTRIVVLKTPDINLIKEDTVYLCSGETYQVWLNNTEAINFLWQDGDTNHYYLFNQTGTYSVQADIQFCRVSDTIKLLPCTDFWIPNAFTPNGDNVNDIFLPATSQILLEYELLIFDRWGQQLFFSNDVFKGWDGCYKGGSCKSDTYVYRVIWLPREGGKQQRLGMVMLLR